MTARRQGRPLSLGNAIVLCIILLASLGLAPYASSDEGSTATPKIRKPSFPLEPDKKPSQPINPKSYVEGADEPPPTEAEKEVIPRLNRGLGTWWSLLQLGWMNVNQSAQHFFSAPVAIPALGSIKRNNNNLLSLSARYEVRPPIGFLSLGASGMASWGTAEAGLPLAITNVTRFSAQDYRAAANLMFHPLSRTSRHDVALGADVGIAISSYATLTPDLQSIDVDNRNIVHVTPRLVYTVSPSPNWSAELQGGYLIPLSTGGQGDVKSSDLTRIEGGVSFIRYLDPSNSLVLGALYAYEKARWTQTAPFVLSDLERTRDLRLMVSWRSDF